MKNPSIFGALARPGKDRFSGHLNLPILLALNPLQEASLYLTERRSSRYPVTCESEEGKSTMSDPERVAVVTGGAQGIGRRTAELLAERGFRLAIVDLQEPKATVAAIEQHGGAALAFSGDVTREDVVEEFARSVLDRFGRVDVLVNNAGISLIRAAEETTADEYRRVMEVNLVAPFLLAQVFGRKMLEARRGSIVNVASIAGLIAVTDRAAYNASKHGLVGLTRTLAAEWGGRGVRVNAVCPGWVKTEMDEADQAGGSYTDADITQRVPMGRFARTDDVARAIAFLADDAESGFVNGHALTVDGGWSSDGSWESARLKKRISPEKDSKQF
jgi:NAD(P)-dependent dehydrogenase (short-subunit alcohol dehydrogenase family)